MRPSRASAVLPVQPYARVPARPFIVVRTRAEYRPPLARALLVIGGFAVLSLGSALVMAIALYRATAPATPLEAAYAPPGTRPVALDSLSPWVVKATVSTEDATFFEHRGISLPGLLRAAFSNLLTGRLMEGPGGSSITQQLAKNVLVPPQDRLDRSFSRKAREAFYAIGLERQYSKEEILGWYLGVIYYGNGAHGIEAASQTYFQKPARFLTLAEASFLAGIPQWPARYDPFTAFDDVKRRQAEVLELMVAAGKVTFAEAQAAINQPLDIVPPR